MKRKQVPLRGWRAMGGEGRERRGLEVKKEITTREGSTT
jgi:hypothetical protein